MARIRYEIVEHNDGWAYRVDDVYSETFATHAEAVDAAKAAAAEQEQEGSDEHIEFQDEGGNWRQELAPGDDRPETEIRDDVPQKRSDS